MLIFVFPMKGHARIWSLLLGLLPLLAEAQAPKVEHPAIGTKMDSPKMTVELVGRRQNYNPSGKDRDPDVHSPKSIHVHPSGEKYYVNSLEGGKTVVYSMSTGEKLATVSHRIGSEQEALWAPSSGLFHFHHTYKNPDSFTGRPVESAFSHEGRYLWIPYYRRSYDLNAQEPSAMAVIDTQADTLVRLFETGPLPKMIAASPDGTLMAVTHWGDNTVGLLDIASEDPQEWHYSNLYIVDYQLKLNFSTTAKVDRDNDSGYCLRGTVFTPDGRYLLVGCMGGGGGIAVIDLDCGRYLGRLMGTMPNLRHLVISRGFLYASINKSGHVQRLPLKNLYDAIAKMDGKTLNVEGWTSCKVPPGARTIAISPDGKYIYVACHGGNCLAVVSTDSFRLIGTVGADSFPVGLDISKDGRYVFTTSQNLAGCYAGNAVNIFKVTYKL